MLFLRMSFIVKPATTFHETCCSTNFVQLRYDKIPLLVSCTNIRAEMSHDIICLFIQTNDVSLKVVYIGFLSALPNWPLSSSLLFPVFGAQEKFTHPAHKFK